MLVLALNLLSLLKESQKTSFVPQENNKNVIVSWFSFALELNCSHLPPIKVMLMWEKGLNWYSIRKIKLKVAFLDMF